MSNRDLDLLPPEKNGYPTTSSRLKKIGIIFLIILAALFIYGQSILDQQQTQPSQTNQVSDQQDEDDDDNQWLDGFEADWD